MSSPVKSVAIIDVGAIGASWAAIFLAQGLTVKTSDINPDSEIVMRRLVSDALPVLKSLNLLKNPSSTADDISFSTDLEETVTDVDFVQENGPEKLDLEHEIFENIAKFVGKDTIIATSSSGLTCSSIQEGLSEKAIPSRVVVGHPFNPPHLIPLVEVFGGKQTSTETIERTMAFYNNVGKKAVQVNKEVVGHIANRLQAALTREVLHLLHDDVVSIAAIDDVMSFGPGLRWGIMDPNLLAYLAGGEGGIAHMADHLLQPMTGWWAPTDPVVDAALTKKYINGTIAAVNERKFHDLVTQRDEELVTLLNLRQKWDGYAENRKTET